MHNILSFHSNLNLPNKEPLVEYNSLDFNYENKQISSLFIFCDNPEHVGLITNALWFFILKLKDKSGFSDTNFKCTKESSLLFFIQFLHNDDKYIYQLGSDSEFIEERLSKVITGFPNGLEIFYSDSKTIDLPDEYIQAITDGIVFQCDDVQHNNPELFNYVSNAIDGLYSKCFITDSQIGDQTYKLINAVTYAIENNKLLVLDDLSFLHYNSITSLMRLATDNSWFGLLFSTTNIGLLATENIHHEHIVIQDHCELINLTSFVDIDEKSAYNLIRVGRVGGVPMVDNSSLYDINWLLKE